MTSFYFVVIYFPNKVNLQKITRLLIGGSRICRPSTSFSLVSLLLFARGWRHFQCAIPHLPAAHPFWTVPKGVVSLLVFCWFFSPLLLFLFPLFRLEVLLVEYLFDSLLEVGHKLKIRGLARALAPANSVFERQLYKNVDWILSFDGEVHYILVVHLAARDLEQFAGCEFSVQTIRWRERSGRSEKRKEGKKGKRWKRGRDGYLIKKSKSVGASLRGM
jgi:hypothetical protein